MKRLATLRNNEHPRNLESIKQLQGEIDHLLKMEYIKWKQRAKHNWYKNGNRSRNTQFFHVWANQRRKIDHIGKIQDDEGNQWTKPEDIGGAFIQYYQQLFTTAEPIGVEDFISNVEIQVTEEMNNSLTRDFSPKEVDMAIAQMHPLKAPGPDGYGVYFFQKYRSIVGGEVHKATLDFLNHGLFDPKINSTHIASIPKATPSTKVT